MNSYITIQVRVAARQAQAALAGVGGSVREVEVASGRAGSALGGLANNLKPNALQSFGNRLQWTGRALMRNFTYPLAIAGGAALKFELDNEKAMVGVTKVYGDGSRKFQQLTRTEIPALGRAFEALSNEFAVNRKEVIGIGAEWAQAGASGIALAKSTKLTLETMILGEMNATGATQALIAIQAQYGQSVDQLSKTIDVLNMVENQTGITMEGLVQGFARAAGTARSAGVDVRHLAAFLAALTPAAGTAANAGNALKTIFSRLMAPTKDAADVMQLMGIHVKSLTWQSMNGTQRLEEMARKFHGLSDAQRLVVSSTIASRYQINRFDVLMRDVYSKTGYYARALGSTASAAANFRQRQYELNQVLTSNPQRLKQIWTILQNALADVIQPLIPAIVYLSQEVVKMVTWFTHLDPSVQKLIGTLALLIALLGPVAMYIGAVGNLLGTIRMLSGLAGKAIFALVKDLWALVSVPLEGLATGIGAVMGFIMKLGVGVVGAMEGVFSGLFTFLFGGFRMLVPVVTSVISALMGRVAAISGFFAVLRTQFQVLFSFLELGFINLPKFLELGFRSIFAFLGRFFIIFAGAFTRLPPIIGGIFARIGPAIGAVVARIGPMLVDFFTGPIGWIITAVVALIAIFHRQIASAWNSVVESFRNNGRGVVSAFAPIARFFATIIDFIQRQFDRLPQGVQNAFAAVVRVVAWAAKEVYKLFSYFNPFAHHSPSLVENTQKGMKVVQGHHAATADSASGLYKQTAFDISTFNQATGNLNTPQKQFADQRSAVKAVDPKALASFDRLISDLTRLNALLARQKAAVDAQQAVVDVWAAKLQKANDYLDAQQKKLEGLQKHLDAVQSAMDAHQQALDNYANAPIKGMKEMNDKIFANEIAAKKLQLAMLKWQDANGSIDTLQSKLSGLAGEIDKLKGEQSNLRAAGAGSDVLASYDQQIAALQQQQAGINSSISAYQDMSKQLDQLNQQGQELQLTADIKFDPLTKQIQDLANAQKELPYDQIIQGIKDQQAAMSKLQPKLDAANAAVDKQQKVVDAATAARDRIQARYDRESKKLEALQAQYQKTQDAISAVTDALNQMGNAAQQAQSKSKKAGASLTGAAGNFQTAGMGNFPDVGGLGKIGREGGLGDQSKLIDQFTKNESQKLGQMFSKFDLFAPIRKYWGKFVGWWDSTVVPLFHAVGKLVGGINLGGFGDKAGKVIHSLSGPFGWIERQVKLLAKLFGPDVKRALHGLVDGFKDLWKQVAPQVKAFGQLISPLWQLIKSLWVIAKPILLVFAAFFVGRLKMITVVISSVIRPAFHLLATVISGTLQVVRGVVGFIIHFLNLVIDSVKLLFYIFTGQWGKAFSVLKTIITRDLGGLIKDIWNMIDGLWRIIEGIFSSAVQAVWGIIKGFVEGIIGFFTWLWDELVGHSIIPDMINAIISWFESLPGKVLNGLASLGSDLIKLASKAMHMLWDGFKNVWSAVWNWIKGLPGKIWDGLVALHDLLHNLAHNAFTALWNAAKGVWNSVWGWIKGLPQSAWNALSNIVDKLGSLGHDAISTLWDKAKSIWTSVSGWFSGLPGKIAGFFSNIGSKMAHKFAGMFDGVKDAFKTALNWVIDEWDKMHFKIGGWKVGPVTLPTITVGLPHIPELARGGKTSGPALVGEGRAAFPEYVIPTDPAFRSRAMSLLLALAHDLGTDAALLAGLTGGSLKSVPALASGGVIGQARTRATPAPTSLRSATYNEHNEYHFHGNLEFPNITSGDDAEEFLSNLESLAGA